LIIRKNWAGGAPNVFQKSLLQNYLQLADKCQGMTSVVPKMIQTESGFSRCGIASD
jgi:hypothetical protein